MTLDEEEVRRIQNQIKLAGFNLGGSSEKEKEVKKSSKHKGPHCYRLIRTTNGKHMFTCSLPACAHSINNIIQIAGRANLCGFCMREYVIDDAGVLTCDECREEGKAE